MASVHDTLHDAVSAHAALQTAMQDESARIAAERTDTPTLEILPDSAIEDQDVALTTDANQPRPPATPDADA